MKTRHSYNRNNDSQDQTNAGGVTKWRLSNRGRNLRRTLPRQPKPVISVGPRMSTPNHFVVPVDRLCPCRNLSLQEYISKQVSENLAATIRDRDVLETESSIKVFERAWGWVKIVGAIAAVLLAIMGAGILWKVSDWWHAVDTAKSTVTETANTAKQQIQDSSNSSLTSVQNASLAAQKASGQAATDAKAQSQLMSRAASETKQELSQESADVKNQVEATRSQLGAAQALRPGMEETQKQLATALEQVQAQQKAISSSQNFVKEIFSSYTTDIISVGNEPKSAYAIQPQGEKPFNINGKNIAFVYLLLHSTPIQGTVQLQWGVFAQPRNSYFMVAHNLLVTLWGDPQGGLGQNAFDISYFPDTGDKETIKSLTVRDGRVYADGEPLPKLGQVDPDFKGNKWMPAPTQAK